MLWSILHTSICDSLLYIWLVIQHARKIPGVLSRSIRPHHSCLWLVNMLTKPTGQRIRVPPRASGKTFIRTIFPDQLLVATTEWFSARSPPSNWCSSCKIPGLVRMLWFRNRGPGYLSGMPPSEKERYDSMEGWVIRRPASERWVAKSNIVLCDIFPFQVSLAPWRSWYSNLPKAYNMDLFKQLQRPPFLFFFFNTAKTLKKENMSKTQVKHMPQIAVIQFYLVWLPSFRAIS